MQRSKRLRRTLGDPCRCPAHCVPGLGEDSLGDPWSLSEPEFRAERLGYALRSLAAELVDERHKVAQLRREVAGLRAQLKSLKEPHPVASEIARRK